MKTRIIISTLALSLASLSAAQAQFTTGNLVVEQVGTGSAALSNASTAVQLDQFTTGGSAVNTLAIPSTGSSSLTNSGTATSEGELTLSANNQYLVLAGYNVNSGVSGIASTASSADPRAVATVDASGNYVVQATTSVNFSGNNIRSGTSDGSGNFWAAGGNTGQVYMGTGTPDVISSTVVNSRIVQDIGGNLFFSTGSGSTRGIYEISGLPTSGSPVTALSFINTSSLGTVSPYGFAFNPAMNTAYIADSDPYTTSAGLGGIEKWALVGSTWTFQYSLPTLGSTGSAGGANGLVVDWSGTNPKIYATTGDGTSLLSITDTGSSATASLLASAPTNTAFRGLEFAPTIVPEPSALALLGLGLPRDLLAAGAPQPQAQGCLIRLGRGSIKSLSENPGGS